ncbi:hypothetical protein [Mesorhizobium sp. WSM2239]|uniref:HTH luxR-type domain-containing protein n=2 Tax=unclassified Mesorhizobium TaxID=325217 RepID=A0AAU8D2Q0_9HYPH
MSDKFPTGIDLFGDPIPANWGMRGRPEHVPSSQNRNKVSMLLALGWSNKRIAASLFITMPTLRKHYFSELRYRAVARDRLDAAVAMKLWDGVQDGNVGAIREFRKMLERNDLMLYGQTSRTADGHAGATTKPAKVLKLGKKDAERQAAHEPDPGTPLGELMARRQGQQIN